MTLLRLRESFISNLITIVNYLMLLLYLVLKFIAINVINPIAPNRNTNTLYFVA